MKVYCKECNIPLTWNLELYTGKSFGEADKQNFVQKWFYTISDGNFFHGTTGCVIINIENLVNAENHPDPARLNGGCGMDGCGGPNKVCINGHEVATEKSDCWMPHAVIFEKGKVYLK